MTDGPAQPVTATLTAAERRLVGVAAVVPLALVAVWRGVVLAVGRGTVADLVAGVIVYGGLLALTTGVLAHERLLSNHCPRCDASGPRDRSACEACGHDVVGRPTYRCPDRHTRYLDEGLCDCGQRLALAPAPRGIAVEVKRMLWMGAWFAAFLLGMVVLLRYVPTLL